MEPKMNDAQVKALALSLMKANSEEEVIGILKTSGYWDDPKLWRFYGDYENNYNAIGNQQGRPDAALVEKFVNSIDARLMNECLERGIDPEGPNAPLTIREAVARFFETEVRPDSPQAGQVKNWATDRRTEVGRGLTLVATGAGAKSGNPCFTISDCGEGQTPEKMPETILSLTRSNKLRIPFVQGKFNMGGTGVFEFCGPNGLQFVLTRRHPKILRGKLADPSDGKWGGDRCAAGERRGRASEFCLHLSRPSRRGYCPGQGRVLRFAADSMPIFPTDRKNPYARESPWGTLINLYEYAATGFRSNIIMSRPSLLNRMDFLLPDVALPIRLYECHPTYRGHEGSFETTLTGLGVRLEDDRRSRSSWRRWTRPGLTRCRPSRLGCPSTTGYGGPRRAAAGSP
jgi:hypothetical protein